MGGNSLCVIVHHDITELSSQRGTLSSYYQPVTGMNVLFLFILYSKGTYVYTCHAHEIWYLRFYLDIYGFI
jgi:hypothetical protein